MAWVNKSNLSGLASAFGKQKNTIGNMHAPAAMLHHKTMMPLGNAMDNGATKGNGPGLGNPMAGGLGGKPAGSVSGAVQSPAQHASTVKAGMASGMKRKKIF